MLQIDKIAYTNRLTKINPMLKFVVSITLLFTAIIFENILFYLVITVGIAMILTLYAGIELGRYIKLLLIPSSFLFMSIMTILLSISSSVDLFIYKIQIGNIYIGITQTSLDTCIILLLRSIACLSATYLLALTLPMNQLIRVLKTLKMPTVVIEMVMLIYRFIMMFLEEYNEMQTALYLKFGYGNLRISYRSIALLITSLFTRMMSRYEELNISLEVKLYNGDFHV
ncbi:cobalt ECF transporter T component CbiQ [Alkalibaculum sp. M08DMB]|uniref:Cobalt ECF transporter T component CbiQ n=1 Tax=Alkalibaculum sporogenes TaxID=2655001 RepID=A0A6A7KA89_9FIRM|nr:cobalt ECF transporter T component CbiQ [Alkalibaculum sporogenes]MPW26272.1 cobalt ECF transporter T component CbiQ [Alkalibaculum sporogenes]